jgi:hypothetical protein
VTAILLSSWQVVALAAAFGCLLPVLLSGISLLIVCGIRRRRRAAASGSDVTSSTTNDDDKVLRSVAMNNNSKMTMTSSLSLSPPSKSSLTGNYDKCEDAPKNYYAIGLQHFNDIRTVQTTKNKTKNSAVGGDWRKMLEQTPSLEDPVTPDVAVVDTKQKRTLMMTCGRLSVGDNSVVVDRPRYGGGEGETWRQSDLGVEQVVGEFSSDDDVTDTFPVVLHV